jgi:hypothetical protein
MLRGAAAVSFGGGGDVTINGLYVLELIAPGVPDTTAEGLIVNLVPLS